MLVFHQHFARKSGQHSSPTSPFMQSCLGDLYLLSVQPNISRHSSSNRHRPSSGPSVVALRGELKAGLRVRIVDVPQDQSKLKSDAPEAGDKSEDGNDKLEGTDSRVKLVSVWRPRAKQERGQGKAIPNDDTDGQESPSGVVNVPVPTREAAPASRFKHR